MDAKNACPSAVSPHSSKNNAILSASNDLMLGLSCGWGVGSATFHCPASFERGSRSTPAPTALLKEAIVLPQWLETPSVCWPLWKCALIFWPCHWSLEVCDRPSPLAMLSFVLRPSTNSSYFFSNASLVVRMSLSVSFSSRKASFFTFCALSKSETTFFSWARSSWMKAGMSVSTSLMSIPFCMILSYITCKLDGKPLAPAKRLFSTPVLYLCSCFATRNSFTVHRSRGTSVWKLGFGSGSLSWRFEPTFLDVHCSCALSPSW